MIYVASPYTHADPEVREKRFTAAFNYTHYLMQTGRTCFSPIVYGHQFHTLKGVPQNFEFWQDLNNTVLILASEVHVLKLPDWELSRGIKQEIHLADQWNIPVRFIDHESI